MDFVGNTVEDFLSDESFLRYCRGEDEQDIVYWEQWIASHPAAKPLAEEARLLFNALSGGQGDLKEQLDSLKDGIERHDRLLKQLQALPEVRTKTVTRKIYSVYRYAAGVLVLMVIAAALYVLFAKRGNQSLAGYEHYTAMGEHKTILLPDSSLVMLNENSHLTVSKNFGEHGRSVMLTGEAYFDIKTNAQHPFTVNAGVYKVRVLGTSFNVKAYPGNSQSSTTLISGKVALTEKEGSDQEAAVVLQPNEKFILDHVDWLPGAHNPFSNGRIEKLENGLSLHSIKEIAWSKKRLEFSDQTFGQIAGKLEAWYGVKIKFKDERVKNYRYTATFYDETILEVLQYLQISYPFSFKFDKDTVVIAPR